MTAKSSSAAAFDPSGNYGRERLGALAHKIHEQVVGATVSDMIEGSMGFHSVTVTLPSGLGLLASTDADMPEALFEVIRFLGSDDVQQYEFETRASLGSAYCDKLSSPAVIALLKRYMQPDVQPPVTARRQ